MTLTPVRRATFLVLLGTVWAVWTAPGCAKHKDYNKGLVLMKKGKYKEAAAAFEKAIQRYPDMGEAHYNLGAAHYYMAVKAMDKGDKTAALNHLKLSISAKLKARDLFQKGKFKVIQNKERQRAVLSHLDHLASQWKEVGARDQDLLMYLSGQKMPEPPPDMLQPPASTPPGGRPPGTTDPAGGPPSGSAPTPTRPQADNRPAGARPEAGARASRPEPGARPAPRPRPTRPARAPADNP